MVNLKIVACMKAACTGFTRFWLTLYCYSDPAIYPRHSRYRDSETLNRDHGSKNS